MVNTVKDLNGIILTQWDKNLSLDFLTRLYNKTKVSIIVNDGFYTHLEFNKEDLI